MKKIFLIVISFLCFFAQRIYAQNLENSLAIPYESNCKYGLIESNTGKIIVAPKFESIEFFGSDFLKVKFKKNKNFYYGIFSNNGKVILPYKYENVSVINGKRLDNEDAPQEIFFEATFKGNTQYFTMSGKIFKLKEKLNYMPVSCGGVHGRFVHVFPFLMDGKWGVIKDNCVLIEPWYDSTMIVYSSNPETSWIITTYNKGKKIMNENGEFINKPIYDDVELIDNFFRVTKNNLVGIVDLNGKEIIPIIYNSIQPFSSGANNFFVVSKNGQSSLINKENKILLSLKNLTIENNEALSGFILTDNTTNKKGFYCYNGLTIPCSYSNILSIVYSRFVLVNNENDCNFYYDMKTKKELRKK